MVVDHMTRCNMGCIGDETSGIGLGLSRRRDGVGTEHGTSHNSTTGWGVVVVSQRCVPGADRFKRCLQRWLELPLSHSSACCMVGWWGPVGLASMVPGDMPKWENTLL